MYEFAGNDACDGSSRPGEPLNEAIVPVPKPGTGQVLIMVVACGVCRNDLRIIDGELKGAKLHFIPGYKIMGTVVGLGEGRVYGAAVLVMDQEGESRRYYA